MVLIPGTAGAGPAYDNPGDLNWTDCPAAAMTDPGTQCAEVQVPKDYSVPGGETITVTVSRIPATSGTSQGVIAGNPGGPGGDALGMFADGAVTMPEQITQDFDLIAVQPRGLRWSTPLDCDVAGIPTSSLIAGNFGALYAACESQSPGYAEHITTENTARDLEEVRKALGVDRIGLYGTSYGTDLMSTYATLFGDKVDGLVLDSAVDASDRYFDLGVSREPWRRDSMNEMFRWIADRNDEYGLGTTPLEVYTRWSDMVNNEAGAPGQVYPPPAEVGDIPESLGDSSDALVPLANELLPVVWRGHSFISSALGGSAQMSPTMELAMQGMYTEAAWPVLAETVSSGVTPQAELPEGMTEDDLIAMMVSLSMVERSIICNDNTVPADPTLIPRSFIDIYTGGDMFEMNANTLKSGHLCIGWPAQGAAVNHSPADLDRQPLVLHYTNDSAVTGTPAGEAMRDSMNGELILLDGHNHVALLPDHAAGNAEVQEAVVRQYTG